MENIDEITAQKTKKKLTPLLIHYLAPSGITGVVVTVVLFLLRGLSPFEAGAYAKQIQVNTTAISSMVDDAKNLHSTDQNLRDKLDDLATATSALKQEISDLKEVVSTQQSEIHELYLHAKK